MAVIGGGEGVVGRHGARAAAEIKDGGGLVTGSGGGGGDSGGSVEGDGRRRGMEFRVWVRIRRG